MGNITLPKEKLVRFMDKNQGDPEDPHDHIYLSETSRKYTKVGVSGETEVGESQAIFEDELDIDGDTSVSATAATRLGIGREQRELMSLDALILRSVDQCSSDELKRKMLSTILLVGGGVRFRGIDRKSNDTDVYFKILCFQRLCRGMKKTKPIK